MKIAIAGIGYVGLSLATLLSVDNEVYALDVLPKKTEQINKRICPIEDKFIEKYFKEKKLNLIATTDWKKALTEDDFIIISTPTNYDENSHFFDTSSVEDVIKKVIKVKNNNNATIIIKSTVPVGFTKKMKNKYKLNILFCPEFLREGHALYDNLYPARIIIGGNDEKAKQFGMLLANSSLKKDVNIKYMDSTEAEAVKLFSNTYLAMRIAYFNELDTYAEMKNLNAKNIIEGVCLDSRIGLSYNNPSFGYGGYCLPKDTKQLLANYKNVPQDIIKSIVESNKIRKRHITDMILKKSPRIVGVYRLTMKSQSDNFRESAILDIIKNLKYAGMNIVIYEPILKNQKNFDGIEIVNDLKKFKNMSSLIIANRYNKELEDVKEKVYTRDIFEKD